MKQILREIIRPEDVDTVCPPPTPINGTVVQTHGFEGITDPRDRIQAETAAHLLELADRRNETRDGARLAELRRILVRNGYVLMELESAGTAA